MENQPINCWINKYPEQINHSPFECNHNWNGPSYYVTASGKLITYKTHPEWIGYVDSFRSELIHFKYNTMEGDVIVEGGSTCLKCGCPFKPNYFF
jgi:hypothetical protein